MYRIFGRNLNNYFALNRDGEVEKEFRLRIAQVLRGLADRQVYETWACCDEEKYEEINNLVFEIQRNTARFRTFESFARDLWGYGYIAKKSGRFPQKIVEEQLRLIHLLLGTQYWIEIPGTAPQPTPEG